MATDDAWATLKRGAGGDRAWSILAERWAWVVLTVGVLVQAYSVHRVVPSITPTTRPWLLDSLIFEYVGWFLTTGARLYVDVWEVKPPLAFEVTALLALLSGGDPLVYHGLAVLVTNAAVVASALLAGALAVRLAGDGTAGLVAGLSLFAFPAFHWRAAYGFKAKYFVILFGLLGVYLVLRERPFGAGVSAGASVGFWQLAAVFPVLVLGIALAAGDRRDGRWAALGTVAAAAAVVAPVVLWDALGAMVTETVLVPLVVTETGSVVDRIRLGVRLLGFSLPVVALGAYGVVRAATGEYRAPAWWVPAGALWFAAQVLLFDLDSSPDLFAAYPFVALGLGLLATTERTGRVLLVMIVAVAAVNVTMLGGPWVNLEAFHVNEALPLQPFPGDRVTGPLYDRQRRQLAFWHQVPTDHCRIFLGKTQYRLVRETGVTLGQCGDPGPVWRALLARLPG